MDYILLEGEPLGSSDSQSLRAAILVVCASVFLAACGANQIKPASSDDAHRPSAKSQAEAPEQVLKKRSVAVETKVPVKVVAQKVPVRSTTPKSTETSLPSVSKNQPSKTKKVATNKKPAPVSLHKKRVPAPATKSKISSSVTPLKPVEPLDKSKANVVAKKKIAKVAPKQVAKVEESIKTASPGKGVKVPSSSQVAAENLPVTEDGKQPAVTMDAPANTVDQMAPENATGQPLILDLNAFPFDLGNGWKLDKKTSPLNGDEPECQVSLTKTGVDDGYEKSKITLYLSQQGVWFYSSSVIDMTYPDVGISLVAGEDSTVLPFTKQFSDKGAFLRTAIENLPLDLSSVELHMGFWPTWPVTHTRQINFHTKPFAQIRRALDACANL